MVSVSLIVMLLMIVICADDAVSDARCYCFVRYKKLHCEQLRQFYFGKLLVNASSWLEVTNLQVVMRPKIYTIDPRALVLATSLRTLRLEGTGLRGPLHPDSLQGLTQLNELQLIGPHRLRVLRGHTFVYTPFLEYLNLEGSGLQTIEAEAFCELQHLRKLSLRRNRLLTFSCDWFAGLGVLESLDLREASGTDDTAWTVGRGNVVPTCVFCPLRSLMELLVMRRINADTEDEIDVDSEGRRDVRSAAEAVFGIRTVVLDHWEERLEILDYRESYCRGVCPGSKSLTAAAAAADTNCTWGCTIWTVFSTSTSRATTTTTTTRTVTHTSIPTTRPEDILVYNTPAVVSSSSITTVNPEAAADGGRAAGEGDARLPDYILLIIAAGTVALLVAVIVSVWCFMTRRTKRYAVKQPPVT